MRPHYRAAAWLLAIVALAVAGSAVADRLASVQSFHDASTHTPYSIAYALPIHVVQAADPGWNVLVAVWVMLAAIAFAGTRFVKALSETRGATTVALIAAFLAAGFTLSAFAIAQSSDIYYYVLYGRLYGLYGVNPYVLGAKLSAAHDPLIAQLLPFTNNPPFSDPYGPLWTLCAGLQSRILSGASLWWSAWSFRALAIVAAAVAAAGILRALRHEDEGTRVRAAGTFAFHPLVLYETAVGGHNDMLMVAPAIWAFAIVEEFPLVAGVLLGAAIAVKYVAAIALPFLMARARKGGLAAPVLTGVLALLIPVLCAHPFQAGAAGSQALASNGSRFAMSLEWLVNLPFFTAGLGNIPALHWLPSLPMLGVLSWPRILQLAGLGVVAVLVIYGAIRTLRRPDMKYLWRSVLGMLLTLPSMHPWYALWIAPAVACGGRWSTYAWWFGVFAFGCYVVDCVAVGNLEGWAIGVLTCAYLLLPIAAARLAPKTDALRIGANTDVSQIRATTDALPIGTNTDASTSGGLS